MGWLLLSILLNAGIFVLFRYYGRWGLPLLPVVTLNYGVCLAVGLLLGAPLFVGETYATDWWVLGLIQGVLFVTFFFLIGLSTHRSGIAYTSVVAKLSVAIPVLAALVFFQEVLGPWQWLGVALALASIVLVNAKSGSSTGKRDWLLGGVLFVGTGIIDNNFKVFDFHYGTTPLATFQAFVFGTAAVAGTLAWSAKRFSFQQANRAAVLGAGLLLGVVNYGAIYSLLSGLATMPSSRFFPVNNVGQLVLATTAGLLLFGERLSVWNWLGMLLALSAIGLLTFAA